MESGSSDKDEVVFADEAPSAVQAAPEMIGSVVNGTYKLVSKLGEGGMGTVYAARDLNLERDVAVKVIREEMREKAPIVARFRREAQSIAAIKHPNVLDCYAFGVDDTLGVLYMVTPLLEGESLHEAMEKTERFPAERAVKIADQICAGLQAAHARGIVHRDLKPANIFLENGPEGERVKLIDFGLALPTATESSESKSPQITRAGGLIGTPTYMSPEQVQGKDVTALSDLYSLGLVLYQILTGTVAFAGDSVADVLAKQLRDPPPLQPLRDCGIPAALEKAILKATAKRPQDRFDSAKSFAEALRAAPMSASASKSGAIKPAAIQEARTLVEIESPPTVDKIRQAVTLVDAGEPAKATPAGEPAKATPPAAPAKVDGPDDDLVFTDEVGGKPGERVAPAPAEAPKPAAASPPPGAQTGARQRGLGPSSERLKAGASAGALEPPARVVKRPSAPEGAALEPARAGKRSGGSSGVVEPGGNTSARNRRRPEETPAVAPAVKPGGTLGEFSILARIPDPPLPSSGRYPDDEPLRAFKAERKGREALVLELVVPLAAAQDVTVRADRLLSLRIEELEAILAAGRTRDGAFLVVDPRPSLRQSVKEGGPLSEREALAAVRAAARAIAGLRQRGLSHGDPSPRHLLLEAQGAVRLASPARVRPARLAFQSGSLTGDPRYAAPEVLDGAEPTGASDVYTLGLSLLFLVTGHEPVVAEEPFAALRARAALPGRTPDVAVAAPLLTTGARILYARMTALDPAERLEAGELATAIDAFLATGKSPEPPRPRTVPSSLPRALVPLPVAALIAIAGVALIIYAAATLARPSVEDPSDGFRFEVSTDGK